MSLAAATFIGADGTQILQNGVSTAQLNIVGTISDAAGTGPNYLTKIGYGNVIFSGANTYTGPTVISSGTLSITSDSNLGSAPSAACAPVKQASP